MTDDSVLAELARSNPQPHPPAGHDDELVLARILAEPPAPRRRWRPPARVMVPALTVVVVLAVVAAFVRAGGPNRAGTTPSSTGTQRIVLRAEPTPTRPHVTAAALEHEIAILRTHLRALGTSATVTRSGPDEIVVRLRTATPPTGRVLALIAQTPQLIFTDWEGNLIAPDGRTVATQHSSSTSRLKLSQGTPTAAPGTPAAGAMTLEHAVRLASHQPARRARSRLSRIGTEYFSFTRSGRYLDGPATNRHALETRAGARTLSVPQGTLVVQSTGSQTGGADYSNPAARFFVLHDDPALLGTELTSVAASHGSPPMLDFRFTSNGRRAFQELTAGLARRGIGLGQSDQPMYQHFAVIDDGALLSVPAIDYRVYPEGVLATGTASITTGLSTSTNTRLALQLEQATRPLALKIISR